MKQFIGVIVGALLVGSVGAQSVPPPLDLRLPATNEVLRSDSSTSSTTASSTPAAASTTAATGLSDAAKIARIEAIGTPPACDDAAYDKAQVHGSVSTTMVASNHGSGIYNSGTVNISKHYGGCDAPHGGVTVFVSAHTGSGNFHRRGW